MISAIFVDRPRLAVVIAVVITLAGLIALTRIPVAQFPDIVPPQVVVTATYPGASATVVEQSVAQPIEAQVVGVDKMIYMKSASGNDGSYTLTVSFLLGSDPDIDTVNVNNRVQTALAQLPQEVQLEGLSVQKKSSAILQFWPWWLLAHLRNLQLREASASRAAARQRTVRSWLDPLTAIAPPSASPAVAVPASSTGRLTPARGADIMFPCV
jgi:Cu/Ag efflux pump CusA